MIILLIPLIMGLIIGAVANEKGQNFLIWFVYGFLLWPIALIHILIKKDESTKCSKCLETINKKALVCPFCGTKRSKAVLALEKEEGKNDDMVLGVLIVIGTIIFIFFKFL